MEEKILALLNEEYPEIDFAASDALVDDGILDSLTITGIIAALTMEFGITIPYEELDEISVVTKEGKRIILLKNGRFVLPGTEVLNEPLERWEKDAEGRNCNGQ